MEILIGSVNLLFWDGRTCQCCLGHGGVAIDKTEGDGATPAGSFPLRRVFYRPDRLEAPETKLPVQALEAADGWSDDPADSAYNTLIKLPYPARHERLWREDGLYDVIVEVGYNDDPVIPGRGSAVFMHVAKPGYEPTEGCVALALKDLLLILEDCDETTRLCISPEQL